MNLGGAATIAPPTCSGPYASFFGDAEDSKFAGQSRAVAQALFLINCGSGSTVIGSSHCTAHNTLMPPLTHQDQG